MMHLDSSVCDVDKDQCVKFVCICLGTESPADTKNLESTEEEIRKHYSHCKLCSMYFKTTEVK